MRRRLSVALVLVGGAAVVVLWLALAGDADPVERLERRLAGGDWDAAVVLILEAAGRDPPLSLPDGAWDRLIDAVGKDPDAVDADLLPALLHHLATTGDQARVAELADGCVAPVPAGWGPMGSDSGPFDERPVRAVYLDSFAIDRFEVTNAQYLGFVAATGAAAPPGWDSAMPLPGTLGHPVVGIPWDRADGYCRWAGKRLPTEAEWERACRGTEGRTYPWGNRWDEAAANVVSFPLRDPDDAFALLRGPGPPSPDPVGAHRDRSLDGVFDLAGNAMEWVADRYDPSAYQALPATNPVAIEPPWNRVVRGGPWILPVRSGPDPAEAARCARRNASHAAFDARIGFRCASSPGPVTP